MDQKTVLELREELRALNLPVSGRKQELIDRLNLHWGRLAQVRTEDQPTAPQFKIEDCNLYTATQLKDELGQLGLSKAGKKEELCRRLAEYYTIGQARVPVLPVAKAIPKVTPKTPAKTPGKAQAKTPALPVAKIVLPIAAKAPAKTPGKVVAKTPGKVVAKTPGKAIAKAIAKTPGKTPALPPIEGKEKIQRPVNMEKQKMFTLDQCDEWTVVRLKERLGDLGLSKTGNKMELCQRLAEHYTEQLPTTKGINNLLFTQPTAFRGEVRRGGEFPNTVKFNLNDRMFNLIPLGAQEYQTNRGKRCQGNAFLFGPLLDLDQYSLLGAIDSTDRSIAFLDHNQWILDRDHDKGLGLEGSPVWRSLYPKEEWNDETKIPALREELPILVWIGGIERPDLPVKLFAHFNREGDYDSLIIDNSCFFP